MRSSVTACLPKAEITVLMPVSFGEEFLPDALESLESQSFDRWHLLALVNGSADGSLKILSRFRSRWEAKVTIFEAPFSIRPGIARNIMAGKSDTEYLTFWDQDDVHPENSLEILYSNICQGAVAIHGNMELIDPDSALFRHEASLRENLSRARVKWDSMQATTRALRNPSSQNRIRLGASLVRSEAFSAVGGFWNFNGGEDYSFWVRLSLLGKISHVTERVLLRRVHGSNLSSSHDRANGNLFVMNEFRRLQSLEGRGAARRVRLLAQKAFHWLQQLPLARLWAPKP